MVINMEALKYRILKNQFGYEQFRPGQEEIIDQILAGRDSLGIMPTGAGKSMCFQIPALCFSGITLVISPLISLMKDQVTNLVQSGVRAAYLNQSLTYRQYVKALSNARQGMYKIIYVAPERLETEGFLSFAAEADISMIAIDEAHCVSQWGHDFRPGYLKIKDFIERLPKRPVIAAFTATATQEVKEDIVRLLDLRRHFEITTGFDRENLYFEVRHVTGGRIDTLLKILSNYQGKAGIIYCSTRKNVEQVCDKLNEKGVQATRYHAGLSDEERKKNQEAFLYDEISVMVATNAFGMGIDRPDVRFVIHYNMPKNMESYYQEAGRAGRDGSPAACVLMYSAQDIITQRYFIENMENDELSAEELEVQKQKEYLRLRKMVHYCNSVTCLREYMLNYFGEQGAGQCKNCSNCLNEAPAEDVTAIAKKLIYAVYSTGQRYGISVMLDFVRGVKTERTARGFLETHSCFGCLAGETAQKVRKVFEYLIAMDELAQTKGQYPVVVLTEESRSVMREEARVLIRREAPAKKQMKNKAEYADEELFDQLKKLRKQEASRQGVPAFVVFTDAALVDMCRKLPTNQEEFLGVSGVGYAKMQNYGEKFLRVIRAYVEASK